MLNAIERLFCALLVFIERHLWPLVYGASFMLGVLIGVGIL